jgi:ribonuclease BN (tRNA processing enzyme)
VSDVGLLFLGSGDAFGSGGRFQACFLLRGLDDELLIDCGASSLVAMKRAGVEPNDVGAVVVSHLHGDHFGGIPFLVLDGTFRHRERPLLVAGPPGTRGRVEAASEALFTASTAAPPRYGLGYLELPERSPVRVGPATVTAFPVDHFSGAPSYGLRIEYGGKILAYSGDTQWTDVLLEISRDADLFVCEANFFEKSVPFHLDYATLRANLPRLACRRIVVTHMSAGMLGRADVEIERAHDGMEIVL